MWSSSHLFRLRFFSSCYLGLANPAAAEGVFVAALLIVSFWYYRRDGQAAATSAIDGDKCQVGGADMTAGLGVVVLDPDFYADLHRRIKHAVDGGAQDHDVADAHGHKKIKMIDGRRDHIVARVPMRGHGRGHVDPVHKTSADEGIERVGVVGEDDLRHLGLRV